MPFPGAADRVVGELRNDLPSCTSRMLAQGADLVLGGLIGRTDSTVDGGSDAGRTRPVVLGHGVFLPVWGVTLNCSVTEH